MDFFKHVRENWLSFWKDFWQFLNDPEVLRAMSSSAWLLGASPKDTDQQKKPSE